MIFINTRRLPDSETVQMPPVDAGVGVFLFFPKNAAPFVGPMTKMCRRRRSPMTNISNVGF